MRFRVSRRACVVAFACAALALAAPREAGSRGDPIASARLLHRAAQDNIADPSLAARAQAIEQLEEAIRLDPDGEAGNHWQLLGYLRELGAFDQEAAGWYRKAIAHAPGDIRTWLGLGRVHKRQFLHALDREALAAAIADYDTATRCMPPSSEPWLALVPLYYELPDMARARAAADRALAGHPRLADAGLAAAMMAYRAGEIERADSLYRATLPRLASDVRALFDHPGHFVGRLAAHVAAEPDMEDATAGPLGTRMAARTTADDVLPDPDPTTPQNELLLEYWSRVTHAYLLFNDPLRPGLDMRAETYVRYGPPAKVLYNPVDVQLTYRAHAGQQGGWDAGRNFKGGEYDLNAQLWLYPELNMKILMHDRSLTGHWTVPAVREPPPNSTPDASVLSQRHDLLGLQGGFAVFPTLAPPSQRLAMAQTLVVFDGVDGPRLAAYAAAGGDSLQARWVVTDPRGRAVARGAQPMGRSLCEAGRSAAEFGASLAPGRYVVVVSARDRHGRRGLVRDSIVVGGMNEPLTMSELVPCCGQPAMLVDRDAVRLEPLGDGIVRGNSPLAVYFEISRLEAGADGFAHYTFDWSIDRVEVDEATGRTTATATNNAWASREETFKGRVRRQFLSVPIARLARGRYRLVVGVHDKLSGLTEMKTVEFDRE